MESQVTESIDEDLQEIALFSFCIIMVFFAQSYRHVRSRSLQAVHGGSYLGPTNWRWGNGAQEEVCLYVFCATLFFRYQHICRDSSSVSAGFSTAHIQILTLSSLSEQCCGNRLLPLSNLMCLNIIILGLSAYSLNAKLIAVMRFKKIWILMLIKWIHSVACFLNDFVFFSGVSINCGSCTCIVTS